MRYLLVVGFYCNVYSREPRARIFFDGKLIDEFCIKHQLEKKNLKIIQNDKKNVLDPESNKTIIREYFKKLVPSLKFYELEVDQKLKQTNIRIDIKNNDSNYVNGFITRSTLLQFRILCLLPVDKKIYSFFVKKMRDKMNTYRYAWYRRDRINYFFANHRSMHNNAIWIGDNKEKIDGDKIKFIPNFNIGGSGSLYYELIKKYGILSPKFLEIEKNYLYTVDHRITEHIYAKYEDYENQRNPN